LTICTIIAFFYESYSSSESFHRANLLIVAFHDSATGGVLQ